MCFLLSKRRGNSAPLGYLFCNCFLQQLACLELGYAGCGDLDLFLGLGVAAHADTALLYIKYAKAIRKLIKERKGVDVKVSILMYMDYLYPPYPA